MFINVRSMEMQWMVHCCTSAVSILSRLRRHTFPDYMCLKSRLELLTVNRLQVLCMRSSNSKKTARSGHLIPRNPANGNFSKVYMCVSLCCGIKLKYIKRIVYCFAPRRWWYYRSTLTIKSRNRSFVFLFKARCVTSVALHPCLFITSFMYLSIFFLAFLWLIYHCIKCFCGKLVV